MVLENCLGDRPGKVYPLQNLIADLAVVLDYAEFEVVYFTGLTENIRRHRQVGYEILQRIDFPWPVTKAILQHHERLDGSGYPNGLSGEEIILEAKILGVADVVEAMSSHRPYRPALGLESALREISQASGVLYDSEVVDACLKVFTEKRFKFE